MLKGPTIVHYLDFVKQQLQMRRQKLGLGAKDRLWSSAMMPRFTGIPIPRSYGHCGSRSRTKPYTLNPKPLRG